MASHALVTKVLETRSSELRSEWLKDLVNTTGNSTQGRISREELEEQGSQFLQLVSAAAKGNHIGDLADPASKPLRDYLEAISKSRVQQGFSSSETAAFIFSLKRPLFELMRAEAGKNADIFADGVWGATELLDPLGLYTVAAFQRSREELINRQQREMLELSTPVVKLWDGILALPMIGTLDSARTQVVMESLLQRIVETGSQIAILDITGVPTVDTLVAQYLLKTVTALRLMGAECVISGIRPQIAQTIVHLGVDLQGVVTKATLADALTWALKRLGSTVTR
jgi:rsbT co-antagonist protein RsbR